MFGINKLKRQIDELQSMLYETREAATFVRDAAILPSPMYRDGQNVANYTVEWVIHKLETCTISYEVKDEAGKTYEFEHSELRKIELEWEKSLNEFADEYKKMQPKKKKTATKKNSKKK
jgi:prefoldin subunit 5